MGSEMCIRDRMQFSVNHLNEAIAELPIPDKADDEPEEEELVLDDSDE